jgi:hypothetical protein
MLGGPGLLFDLGDRSQPRGVGDERDVARHEPAAESIGECAADDEVHFVDGLGREGSATVGWVQ